MQRVYTFCKFSQKNFQRQKCKDKIYKQQYILKTNQYRFD